MIFSAFQLMMLHAAYFWRGLYYILMFLLRMCIHVLLKFGFDFL